MVRSRARSTQLFGGGGKATLVYRGLAKVLEDRAEFEVVADVPPDAIREKLFTAAAEYRRQMRSTEPGPGHREPFRRDEILSAVAQRPQHHAGSRLTRRSSPTCATRTAC